MPDDEVEILEDMEGNENEDFDEENKDEVSGTEEKTQEVGEEVKWFRLMQNKPKHNSSTVAL